MRKLSITGCTAAIIVWGVLTANAAERRPVPPLVLSDITGAPLESPDLPSSGPWLLVYVRPACPGCGALLDQMNSDERAEPRRIVIIVGGSPEAAQAIKAQYPNLAGVRWFIDSSGAAAKALALPSLPAASGVKNQTIEWTLAGALRGGAELESVLFSWLGRK